MMLPQFPKFKNLEFGDKKLVSSFADKFLPYSDFNFLSLYSWNIEDNAQISILNDNLVLILRDYLTQKPFFTFLGTNDVLDTISTLLKEALCRKGFILDLRLIIEEVVQSIKDLSFAFAIEEDIDNNDYIIDINTFITLSGKKHKSKRRYINELKNKIVVHDLDLKDLNIQREIVNFLTDWARYKNKNAEEVGSEILAVKRFMAISSYFECVCLGFYHKNKMVGFTFNEACTKPYYIGHFGKGVLFPGIYAYMEHITAKRFLNLGYKYMNYEQDLGILGLRKYKKSWCPVRYLKKYKISLTNKFNLCDCKNFCSIIVNF